MNALAMAVAPAIGVSVYQRFGYRTAFCIALAFSIAIIIVIQFIKDKGEPESLQVERKTEDANITSSKLYTARKKPRLRIVEAKVLPVAFIIMLFAIPYCATQSFLVTYAEVRGLNVTVSMFFPSYAVVLIVLRLTLRRFFDKLPFHVFLLAGCISELTAIVLLTVMQNNITMLLASVFLAGGYGVMSSVCQSTAILLADKEKRGMANSTYYIGVDLGMTLGPMIGGSAVRRSGYPLVLSVIGGNNAAGRTSISCGRERSERQLNTIRHKFPEKKGNPFKGGREKRRIGAQ